MESRGDANAMSLSQNGPDHTKASLLASIHTEIKAIWADVMGGLSAFRHRLREDVKKELSDFRNEMNQALGNIREDLKTATTWVKEAEQLVAEIEECNTELEATLRQIKQAQESIQTTDFVQLQQINWKKRQRPAGPDGRLSEDQCRLVAYRDVLEWALRGEKLGRHNRKVLPSCIVGAIRDNYPSPTGQYVGFKEAEEAFKLI
ncbi:hypothetical protein ABVT39_013394 [Epinephelus coioides]